MVIIEEIKKGKKSYTITAGGETIKGVNVNVALGYALKEGEMERARFEEFLKDNARENAKEYLYAMVARKSRTIKEAREKLYGKGFHKDAVEHAISVVSSYGYLNDEEYAKSFVENGSRSKGSFRLKREMQLKGVGEEDLNLALSELDEEDECESAKIVAIKYLKGKDAEDEKTKEKLFRHLVSRGYSYSIVKKTLRELGTEIDED